MEYRVELKNWDFKDLKHELNGRVAENHTIDQERGKISALLNQIYQNKGEKYAK